MHITINFKEGCMEVQNAAKRADWMQSVVCRLLLCCTALTFLGHHILQHKIMFAARGVPGAYGAFYIHIIIFSGVLAHGLTTRYLARISYLYLVQLLYIVGGTLILLFDLLFESVTSFHLITNAVGSTLVIFICGFIHLHVLEGGLLKKN